MTESPDSQTNRSVYRLRWVGYGLLVFALIDAIQTLIPLKLLDPGWQLQTVGSLIERVPIPLLGLALVFFGEYYDRISIEKGLLKGLSWLSLALSVVFALLILVTVVSTARLDDRVDLLVTRQATQQLIQLQQIENRLNQSRPEELAALGDQLRSFGINVLSKDPQALKTEIANRIVSLRAQLKVQAQAEQQEEKLKLVKRSVAWALGSVVASTLFFILWKSTDWARSAD